jgi:hypothetical protein
MNERIRELMEQAGYKPLPGFDFANSLEETYLKKFAELIVRDCADIADTAEPFLASDLIKKHFGVE